MAAPLLVVGLGVTGEAVVRALVARGLDVVVIEDRPTDQKRDVAAALGVDLVASPDEAAVDRIGPEHHELSGRAKDIGSAAVFVALLNAGVVWLLLLLT